MPVSWADSRRLLPEVSAFVSVAGPQARRRRQPSGCGRSTTCWARAPGCWNAHSGSACHRTRSSGTPRAAEPERMIRAPSTGDAGGPLPGSSPRPPRREPAVYVQCLLAEIRELVYTGSMNLLYRYITQGRVEADRPHLSPRRVTRLLLTRPEALSDGQRSLLGELTAACPEMTSSPGSSAPSPPCSGQIPRTRPGSRTGPRRRGPATSRTCTPLPAGWTWPPSRPSPCRFTTAGPRV